MNNENIFRKKTLDRVQSPEDLNEYVRVVNPGIWLLIAAIIVLLLGACIYGIFGRIEVVTPAEVVVKDGNAVLYIPADRAKAVDAAEGKEITVSVMDKSYKAVAASVYTARIITTGEKAISVSLSLPDGTYPCEVILESIKPFSFLFN